MRQFMKLIGFSERIIGKNLKNIDILDNKEYGFEEFEILMFSFFEEKENFKSLDIVLEKENPQNKSNPVTTNKKESGSKYKTCKGLCSIF